MCDDGFKKEINAVCRESLEAIQFLKQQQWRVVYYCLLLFGVLFFLIRFFVYDYNNPLIYYKTPFQWILAFISSVITLVGLHFQIDFQNQIKKNRKYIAYIRWNYFHDETLALFNFDTKERVEKYCFFCRGWEYLVIFYFTILAGFGLLIFMISKSIWLVLILVFILFFAPMIAYVYKDKIDEKMEKLEKKIGSFIKYLRKSCDS